jgi:hypothetical protein
MQNFDQNPNSMGWGSLAILNVRKNQLIKAIINSTLLLTTRINIPKISEKCKLHLAQTINIYFLCWCLCKLVGLIDSAWKLEIGIK